MVATDVYKSKRNVVRIVKKKLYPLSRGLNVHGVQIKISSRRVRRFLRKIKCSCAIPEIVLVILHSKIPQSQCNVGAARFKTQL